MACNTPMKMRDKQGNEVLVPCRHCVGCTIQKIQELRVYAQAEMAQKALDGYSSSFIRLSYNDANLPVIVNGQLKRFGEIINSKGDILETGEIIPTLLKSDFVKFMKRVRQDIKRKYDDRDIKYIYCGEYGEKEDATHRSHYHIILFGLSYLEAKKIITEQWKFGFCDFKPLKAGAVRYIASYMFHDVYGKMKEQKYTSKGVEPPFLYHSTNLGKKYLEQYEDAGQIPLNGNKRGFPKYYRKRYNLKPNFYTAEDLKRFAEESIKRSKEYVIQNRQRGVPVADSLPPENFGYNSKAIKNLANKAVNNEN